MDAIVKHLKVLFVSPYESVLIHVPHAEMGRQHVVAYLRWSRQRCHIVATIRGTDMVLVIYFTDQARLERELNVFNVSFTTVLEAAAKRIKEKFPSIADVYVCDKKL